MTNKTSDYNETWYTTSETWKDYQTYTPDYENPQYFDDLHKAMHIAFHQVLFPVIIFGGAPANVIAFCVWTFGSKSKQVCCAIYFMANAAADFLVLAVSGLWMYVWKYDDQTVKQMHVTDVFCKIYALTTFTFLAISNWMSVVITVERALTIVFPLVFRSQTMRGRSKYVTCVIFILLLLASSPSLYLWEHDDDGDCIIKYGVTYYVVQVFVQIIVPFLLIVIFNVVTVVTLLRHKFRGNHMSSNRPSFVTVFTKIAIVTGTSCALTNALLIIGYVFLITRYDLGMYLETLTSKMGIMLYLNSLVNPIACMLFCKSAREDIKHFVCMIAQKVSRENVVGLDQNATHADTHADHISHL